MGKFGPGETGDIEVLQGRLYVNAGGQSAFGELRAVQPLPVAGWKFNYGVIDDLVTTTVTGSGDVSVSAGQAVLDTTAATSSSAKIETVLPVRYTPGIGVTARFTAIFTEGVAGSTQLIGMGDETDGLFFGYNGASFGIMRRYNGTDTWVAQSNWNKATLQDSDFTLDITNGNVYQIQYQWLGYGAIQFFVEHPERGELIVVHQISYANANITTSLLNPTLPVMAMVENTTNNTAITLTTPSAMAFIDGYDADVILRHPLSVKRPFSSSADAIQAEVPILAIKAGTALNGVDSRVISRVYAGSFAGQGTKPITVRVYVGGTGIVLGGSYSDYDATNSTLSSNTSGTAISGGTLQNIIQIGSTGSAYVEFRNLSVKPNEVIAVTVQSANSADVTASLQLLEMF